MTILIKNKHTLQIDDFKFKCCIGKKGSTSNKTEGDKKSPKGTFQNFDSDDFDFIPATDAIYIRPENRKRNLRRKGD